MMMSEMINEKIQNPWQEKAVIYCGGRQIQTVLRERLAAETLGFVTDQKGYL